MHSNHHYNKSLKSFARDLRINTVSRAEKYIWKGLLSKKQTGFKFLRQRPINNFIVDFFCPDLQLIVEIDGNSHDNKGNYDKYRELKLKSLGYEFVRFKEGVVLNNLDDVSIQLRHIIYCIEKRNKKESKKEV